MKAIVQTLVRYGGDEEALVRFDKEAPEQLAYATLLTARTSSKAELAAVCAVYEWQQRPLLFIVDRSAIGNDQRAIERIRRVLAMRGDAPYLGLVGNGSLDVYQIDLDSRSIESTKLPAKSLPSDQSAVLPHLGNLRPSLTKGRWISDVILNLLTKAIDDLVAEGISDGDAISLVGRALFVRFLADRSLLPPRGVPGTNCSPEELFDSKKAARVTSDWLDETFNGDFLQIKKATFGGLTSAALRILGDVSRGAPGGQLPLGWRERWDDLDFAHIPVGVLILLSHEIR